MKHPSAKYCLFYGALLISKINLMAGDFVSADSVSFTPTQGNGTTVYGSLVRIIDGSGLSEIGGDVSLLTETNIQTVTHDRGYNGNIQYISADGDLTEGDFDFSFYNGINLSEIYVWNYSQGQSGGALNLRGVGAYEVYLDTGNGFVGPIATGTLGESSPVHKAQKIDLGSTYENVIAVRLATTQLPGTTYLGIGLDEVIFATVPTAAEGDLAIGGNLDIGGGSIILGEDLEGVNGSEGAGIVFTDALAGEATETNFLGYRAQHNWLWQLGADSGTPTSVMNLTKEGELRLVNPNGASVHVSPLHLSLQFSDGTNTDEIHYNGSDFVTADGTSLTASSVTGESVKTALNIPTQHSVITIDDQDSSTTWGESNNANRGFASTAWGQSTTASGIYSTAWGSWTLANADYATAWGGRAYARGHFSTAWGQSTLAESEYSTAWGLATVAEGYASTAWGLLTTANAYTTTAFGRYNIGGGDATEWVETDPLFEVGNGDMATPSNALTLLKNGQTTLQNKHWDDQNPTDVPADPLASDGEALVVEGHARFRGIISMEHAQGDISMGAFGVE